MVKHMGKGEKVAVEEVEEVAGEEEGEEVEAVEVRGGGEAEHRQLERDKRGLLELV